MTIPSALITVTISLFLVLQGCGDQRNLPDCTDEIKTRLETSDFETLKWIGLSRTIRSYGYSMRWGSDY